MMLAVHVCAPPADNSYTTDSLIGPGMSNWPDELSPTHAVYYFCVACLLACRDIHVNSSPTDTFENYMLVPRANANTLVMSV